MTIVGIIRPNGRPGCLHPHATGVINLIGPRRFGVNPEATSVVDKPGEDLVLTREVFRAIREAIAGGAPMAIEPLMDDEEDGQRLAPRIALELEKMAEEIGRRGEEIDRQRGQLETSDAEIRALGEQLKQRDVRLAELEKQLAEITGTTSAKKK